MSDNVFDILVERGFIAQVTDEELTAYCKSNLAGFKTPKKFIWVDGPLPRTATGKVQRFVLRDR